MSNENGDDSFDFSKMLDKTLEENSVVDGVIVKIGDETVLVDVGQKIEGRLNLSEIKTEEKIKYSVGDKIPVMIVSLRGQRPSISYKKVLQKNMFEEFLSKNSENLDDITIEGRVTSVKDRVGFTVEDKNGCEYFMPISQGYLKTNQAVGREIKAKILKVDKKRNSIIISRKKLIEDNKVDKDSKISKMIEKNEPIKGYITNITPYGIFVDINGITGLVSYNQISHKGPVVPSKYYNKGDEVDVLILSYDKAKQKIELSIKATYPNPWDEVKESLEVGDTITVSVSSLEEYGAFVDLGNDIEGLLHISEISWNKSVKRPEDVLQINSEINVEIIELDIEKKRLRVSLKSLQEKPFEKFIKKYKISDVVEGVVANITTFGAFITIDNEIDGLLHNENSSWDSSIKCKDIYKKGDKVKSKIIKINTEKKDISLSVKDTIKSPIQEFADKNRVGDIVKAEVKSLKEFGIFVRICDNVDALIRKEDFSSSSKDGDIKIGDEIEAVIVSIDSKNSKIRLSIKRLENKDQKKILTEVNDTSSMTLGDLLKNKI